MSRQFIRSEIPLNIDDVDLNISSIHRDGDKTPIVFLHGFGSTKEDYADITQHDAFEGHPFLAYDAPGCGESYCEKLSEISIPFFVKTLHAILYHFDIDQFHIVGHSMGGLTALMFAHQYPDRVLSFTNIEGNIAPEDCFLSRQIIEHPADNPEEFLDAFIERTRYSPAYSNALYAVGLKQKVRPGAVKGIFESMVSLSDNANLMDKFLSLPFPKMFMYGEQNHTLSYLNHIQEKGVRLAEIPESGHFPMYSNPPSMWHHIKQFYLT